MTAVSTWRTESLGDLAIQITKGTTPTTIGFKYQPEGIPFVKVENIDIAGINLSSVTQFISSEAHDVLKRSQFIVGDVLFSIAGTIGKTALVEDSHLPANTNQAVAIIRGISNCFIPKFLKLQLREAAERIQISNARGGAMNNISLADLKSIEVIVPPLAEQKVIVDKLDTLLAQVESTKARLERIPQILKRFRQSVLAAAVSGKLMEEWRDGASLNAVEGTLDEFVSIDVGYAFKSKEFSRAGIPLLRGQNIEPGSLRWDEIKYFPEDKLQELIHLFINENDIILAMDRPIISSGLKLARAKKSDLPCVLVQRVARFKGYKGLSPEFLYILLSDISFTNYIQPNQTGSDIPHISGKQIMAFPVSIPSIEEQAEIVRRVEQLFAYADTIEQQVQNALARVNNLTQSILAKAFRGELTEQWRKDNPDLISGDNSAVALLEKIKAEREAIKPEKKTQVRKMTA